MGLVDREGAMYFATGYDNTGLYRGKQEAIGIIKSMMREVTSFDVFAGLGTSAAIAFAQAAKGAYDFSVMYEKNMREVMTISSAVKGDFAGYSQAVIDLATEIPVSADVAAKALYQIVSAGYDGADGMKLLEVSAKAAIGGVTDTATASDAITTLLNAYKMSATDAESISDQLFMTAKLGKTTFGELGQSIAQAAPIAASFGIETEQVLAAVATLTKQGTPTAQAMTQIRAAIIGATKVLGDGAFNGRTFQDALQEIATQANGSESALRELVPEIEGMNGILGLTGRNAAMASSDLKQLENSLGATEQAYKDMAQGTEAQLQLLKNNITATLHPMGETVKKKVQEIAVHLNSAFASGDMENAIKGLEKLIMVVGAAFVTYKANVIGATVATTAHGVAKTILTNIENAYNAVLGEGLIARERERVSLETYNSVLNASVTTEQEAILQKRGLQAGTTEYSEALSELAKNELQSSEKSVVSLTKKIAKQQEALKVAQDNVNSSKEVLDRAKEELDLALQNNDLSSVAIATKKVEIATENNATASKQLNNTQKQIGNNTTILSTQLARKEALQTQINTATHASETASTNVLTTAKSRLTLATRTLTTAIKANPIGALLTVVGAVTAAFALFGSETDKTKQKLSRFNSVSKEAFDTVSSSVNANTDAIGVLIKKYDSLSKIGKPNKIQQQELKTVIEQIATLVPEVATSFDEYNQSLGINTSATEKYIKKQKEILAELAGTEATDWMKNVKTTSSDLYIKEQESRLGQKYSKFSGFANGEELSSSEKKVLDKEIETLKIKRTILFKLLSETGIEAKDLRREISEQFSKGGFYSTPETEERNSTLKAFDNYLFEYEMRIQKEDDLKKKQSETGGGEKSAPQLTQLTEVIESIKTAHEDLSSLQSKTSWTKDEEKQIDELINKLSEYKGKYKSLTGLDYDKPNNDNNNDNTDQQSTQLKKEKERQVAENARKELQKLLTQIALDTQQAEIDAMEDGTEKKLAQIDLDSQREIERIKVSYEEKARIIEDAQRTTYIAEHGDDKGFEVNKQAPEFLELNTSNTTQLASNEKVRKDSEHKILNDLKEQWNSWADEYKQIEDKITAITQKASQDRANIDVTMKSGSITPEDGADATNMVNSGESSQISKLETDKIKLTQNWVTLFSDLDTLSRKEIKTLIDNINSDLKNSKLAPADASALLGQLEQAKKKLVSDNPFANLYDNAKVAFKKIDETDAESGKKRKQAWKDLGVSMGQSLDIAAQAMQGIGSIADTLGASDETKQTINEISGALSGMGSIAKGIATGDISSIISGTVGMFTNLFSLFDGRTKRANKAIKAESENIRQLERQYKDMGRAIKSSLGTEYYSKQIGQAVNLQEQIEAKQRQIDAEKSKRKKKQNQEQIQAWEDEQKELTQQIADTRQGIIDELSTTDLKSYSMDLSNSIISGLADGIDNMSEIIDGKMDDLLRNMIAKQFDILVAQKAMKPMFDKMAEGFDENGDSGFALSESELKAIKEAGIKGKEQIVTSLNDYEKLLAELDLNSSEAKKQSATSKGVETINQETASKIDGSLLSMRNNMATISEIIAQTRNVNVKLLTEAERRNETLVDLKGLFALSLDHLDAISKNTFHLNEMKGALNQVQINTSRL